MECKKLEKMRKEYDIKREQNLIKKRAVRVIEE